MILQNCHESSSQASNFDGVLVKIFYGSQIPVNNVENSGTPNTANLFNFMT